MLPYTLPARQSMDAEGKLFAHWEELRDSNDAVKEFGENLF